MPDPIEPDPIEADPIEAAARYAALAQRPRLPAGAPAELEAAVARHPDARARAAALGALVRAGGREHARRVWRSATVDASPVMRRRAAELAPALGLAPVDALLALVADREVLVAETAAWALGEIPWTGRSRGRVVVALGHVTRTHDDPLVREAAVGALGALGDPHGLDAILGALADRPAIRRRAVLALAPFDGPEVDAALAHALTDPDWQVRQAAEDLSG